MIIKREILALYLVNILDGFAGSLFGVFVPIYLFQRGYTIQSIILLYFFYSLFMIGAFALSALVMNRYGLRIMMLMRVPFLLAYMGALIALPKIPYFPLWIIGLLMALQGGFYFFGTNMLFLSNVQSKNLENEIGRLNFWPQLVGLFLPLLGAWLIVNKDYQFVLLITFAIYCLAILPLWFIADFKTTINFSFKQFRQVWLRNQRYTVIEIIKNMSEEVEGIVWPLFVILFFHNILILGWLSFLVGLGGALFTWLVGKYAKKIHRARILKIGLLITALLWLVVYFFPGKEVYLLTSISLGFVGALVGIPFSAYVYRLAKRRKTDEFIIFRELPVFLGRIPVYLLAYFFWHQLQFGFLLAACSLIILSLFNFGGRAKILTG
ncbi:MAG: hypothetical protein WCO55_03015 [Candidatus Falkowbacteria bacterium]